MTSFDTTPGGANEIGAADQFAPSVLSKTLDFAQMPVSASDTIVVFDVPAGAYVQEVWLRVLRPEGGTATVSVGDSGAATGYLSAKSINATAGTVYSSKAVSGSPLAYVSTYGIGIFYAAADTIVLTAGHDLDNARIEIGMSMRR